ncbi:MAG: hypothetical protein ACAF41_06640 [Leptolyngbya sp. BL-A-14]
MIAFLKSFFTSIFLLICYLVPFAFLLWFVINFGVNVPYSDQWSSVDLFQEIGSGRATFQTFFAQHNEHRILFPRLISSALAFASGWNILWELYCNIVLSTIAFLLVFKLSLDQAGQCDRDFHIANVATCFVIFSVIQWENWLWGFQIAWFLVDLCLVIAVLALSSNLCSTLRIKIVLAATACLVASFSLAHGLITWIAVIPSLVTCCTNARQLKRVVFIWIILFLSACLLYLIDYHEPSTQYHDHLWLFLKEPKMAETYFLTLLGNPLGYNLDFSDVLGLAVFVNFVFFVIRFVTKAGSKFSKNAAPWLSLGCFAILFDFMTTIGRIVLGVDQARASRYTTVAILLLVALIQLWRLHFLESNSVEQTNNISRQDGASIYTFIISVFTLLVLGGSTNALAAAGSLRANLQYGQACLTVAAYVTQSPGNCLQLLYLNSTLIGNWKNDLNQIGFRHFPDTSIQFVPESTKEYGSVDTLSASQTPVIVRKNCINCGSITISGWAILPEQMKPAQLVFLSRSGDPETFFTNTYVNIRSPDIAKALRNRRYRRARWATTVSPNLWPLGKTVLTAWVYDPGGNQFVRLHGEPTLSVEE